MPNPLRPIYHTSAFLGAGVPIFEIREAGGMTDVLVRTPALRQGELKPRIKIAEIQCAIGAMQSSGTMIKRIQGLW